MYKISIIIPTYNRRHLIGQTLDSILRQTLPPYEIIVVDDGSTDGTPEWLAQIYGSQVKVVRNLGKGPGAARNMGFSLSTGDYIKFFDSDDWMSPNSLEVQLKALQETGKSFVTSPYRYGCEAHGEWLAADGCLINHHGFPQHKPLTYWMVWGLFICIPTMLFRRSFLDKVGPWPEEMVTSEDWAYLWRMAMLEPFPAHAPGCFFYYRLHEAQSTGANLNVLTRDREKAVVLKEIYHRDVEHGHFCWLEKQLFRNKFYQMARVSPDPEFRQQMKAYSGRWGWVIWHYYRVCMKIGRLRTGTDWQPMHGVKVDKG